MDPITLEELPKANSTEFKSMLSQLEASEEFRSAEDSEKARAIATMRDKYKSTHSLNEMDVRAIDAFSKGASDYNKSSRYRVDSESLVKSGIEYPDVEALPKEVALEKINNFRIQSQEAAETFDPLLKDDYLFDLQREANELERRVRGRETTWGDDKAYRFAQGAVTGLLRSTGSETGDRLASDFETRFLPENPEMDDQWLSELAAAGGDFATTIGMITAATALGGPMAGASAGLTTNAARKYRDGYNEEFARSGDAASAFDVGLASMPGAAIETIGDYFVGGKLAKGIMSAQWRKAYMEAPDAAARHAMVTTALKDANVRNKVIKNFGTGFLTEASTEVLGDNTSGLGAFAVTGESGFIPTAEENLRTASIAGLLGGTVSAAGSAIERRDPILNNEEHVAKLQEFIANGDQAGLTDYFQSQMTSPIPDITTNSETAQEPATDTIVAEKSVITKNDDGTINHVLKDARGQEFTVDESTARLHDAFADYLGAWGEIDKFNDLDPGRGRDQRDNINTNNQRSAQNELALTLEDEINAAIPRRAELFSELDKTAAEVGTPQKEINLAKRLIDSWAVAQIKAGGDPSLVYRPSVQSDVASGQAVTQPDPEQADDTELPSTDEQLNIELQEDQLNIELDPEVETPTAPEIEESSEARKADESGNPEFDIDNTNGEISVSSTEFNPPSEPTLIDGRQVEDGEVSNTGNTAIYNYDEGKITDIAKRIKAFSEVGYSQKNIPAFKSNDAAIEFSKKFKKQIAKARSFYSFDSLGMHHNGGILINESVLSNSDSVESARVLAHELGHAAHSLLGNEINLDQEIKNELIAIEEYLYPGLRAAVSNTENADNRFYNYLLSPNELIAEFNVLRLSDPDTSMQVAPMLQEKLASVDEADNLVVDRKTYPLGIGRIYSKAGDPITTTDKGVKSRSRDNVGYVGDINLSPKYRAESLKEAKGGSIISALIAARWFPKEVQKLIDDGVFDGDFWKDRLQNAVNSVGPQGVLYQDGNSTLSQRPAPSTEGIRHAELELKFNDGTITPEEITEAKSLAEDRARKTGYTESGARSGFYKGGVPLLPSQSGNLGAGYYAILGGTLGDVSVYGTTPVYNQANFDSRRTEEVFIDLGSKPLFVNHPNDISEWVKDNGLLPSFNSWLDLQETINSAYDKIGTDRPDSLEARRAGTLWRETVEAKAERRNTLLAAGYRDIDIEALGLNQESIESPDAGKVPSFLFDRGHATAIIVDWDKSAATGRKSGDGRLGKEVAVANPNQIKSAEPFTGVPLDERFNPDSDSILNQSQANQGTIQFQNEDGSLAPLEVPIDQLNNKLTAMITIMENGGNLSTFIHEAFHWAHRSGMIAQVSTPEELIAFEQAANVSGRIWKEENYEAVARAYEAWLRNPSKIGDKHINVPGPLNKLFWKIASVMKNIYRDLRNSPLPTSLSKGGITQVSIHPDFRAAFERLHYYDPNFRFNATQPTSTPQSAPQSASVTPQLPQGPDVVSSRQQRPSVTEPQLTEDEQAQRDAEDRVNELNIKLMRNFNAESAIDQTAKGLFKSVLDFKSILDPRSELGGLYYTILDNFVKARVLSKKQDSPPQIRRPVGTDRYNQGDFNVVKDPDEPGYTPAISNILRTIEKEAFELWYEDYASKHPELDESSFGDFGSKSEVQEFVKANKVAKAAEEEGGENESRLAINDNIAELQATLRSRVITDPDTGVVTMPDIPMPKTPVAKAAMEKFVHFLKGYNVDNNAVDDAEAMRIQFMLDSLLNDDTALGGTDFAKQMQNAFASSLSPNNKWKAPVSKFGLAGIINSWFGKDISGVFTGLTLFGTNLEKVAGNTPALKALQDFTSAYYHASSHADSKKRDFVKFIADTRKKYTTRKTHLGNFNNTNGIISKLIQVPEDLDVEGRNEAFTHNVTQFTIGVNNMIKQGGRNGETGVYTKQLLDSILLDAPQEYDNFVNHVQEKFPKNFGWINDVSKWIEDELSDDAKFISEWLYGVPFSRFKYYVPTQMINMIDPEVDVESFDGSQMIEGDDKEFQHRNPVHVSRSGNLKERSGFIPLDLKGDPDSRYAYGTNLEAIAIKGVNNIINDIYTGFDRKILGALNPSSGGVYQELERKMGNDSVVVNHLRKVVANMVNTDLNKHKYVTPMESIASSFRRNIAPPMLGSLHQPFSQPAAQMTAYIARRPSSVKYLPKALQIMAMTRKGLDVDINGFREVMERTLGGRALPHDPFLTKGQSVQGPTALDDLISSHVINELEQWTEFKNHTKALHSGIKEAMLFGLRVGDMVSADAIFATELIMAGQREQGISDPAKINYNAISPQAIHDSVIMMDEAINASMNSRRGTYLANPNALFHLLSIFAGHRIAVATTFSTKVRTAIDLFAAGETNDPMFADAGKYILATVMQSVAFTSVRFAVLGFLVKSMYQVLTPEEDDDRHWLYGELEKSEVEKIRKMADEKIQQGFGDGVLSASIARDIFGNVIAVTAFGGLDNVIFTQLFDTLRKPEFEQSKAESIDQIEKQVKALGTSLTPAQLQDFRNQIEAIKKTKFAPMGFKGFESDDLSGAYGAAAGLVTESTGSLMDIPSETKDFTWEEFVLFMRTLGVGQPELTRALKFSAKVKDELSKERFEEEEEIELPEFNF